jgi:hypothetical protein
VIQTFPAGVVAPRVAGLTPGADCNGHVGGDFWSVSVDWQMVLVAMGFVALAIIMIRF